MLRNYPASKRCLLPCFVIFFYSCTPKINFTASPAVITKGDSVLLNWKINGKPTLLFDRRKIAHPPDDSLEILEFTLSVQKGKKVKYIKRQVSVLPKGSADRVVFMTNDLRGDTLIAEGIKDTALWSGFEIISVYSLSSRPINILHAGKKSELKNPAIPSYAWEGTTYAGLWKIMSLLTEAEKQDHSTIPNQLEIKVLIRPRKK
ncbi:MAG: hypothetical protein M3Z26_15710 [Bacteroidota bacterium]|nr:hypothetical protein [Bacteroidota bacterium]